MLKSVRQPRIDLYAIGRIQTHGVQTPMFGTWHTTEGYDAKGVRELEGVVNYWERQGRGYGAAVIIDKDGNSALCAPPTRITYTVENHNTGDVAIELIGFARFVPKVWWVRRKQLDKLARWMAYLNKEYNIPLRLSVTHGWQSHAAHSKVYGGSHWDPGKFFPARYVLRLATKYRADGWT